MTMAPHTETAFRWAPIPEGLIYSDVSGTAIKVYGALARHGLDPTNCYPSHGRLVKLCRLSDKTVRRALTELRETGWISIVERRREDGSQASNGYQLHEHPQGVPPTPLVTDDHPPLVTSDHPPWSPVTTHEREQENESKMNDATQSPRETKEGRPQAVDDGETEQRDQAIVDSLGITGATPTKGDRRNLARARALGWTDPQLRTKAEHARRAADPWAYFRTSLRGCANEAPGSTQHPAGTGRPNITSDNWDASIGMDEGWDDPDVVKAGLAAARAALHRS